MNVADYYNKIVFIGVLDVNLLKLKVDTFISRYVTFCS